MAEKKLVVNELLFYVQNKIHVAPRDVIIETCQKFFSLDEVSAAITQLEKVLNVRLSRRNKSDDLKNKLLNDLYEKIWNLDASSTQISCFVAADLSRVPRENESSGSHASFEQLLASIHGLKSIVSGLQRTMVTKEMLETSLASMKDSSPSASPVSATMTTTTTITTENEMPSLPLTPSAPDESMTLPLLPSAPPLSQALLLPPSSEPSAPPLTHANVASAPPSVATSLNRKKRDDIIRGQRSKMPEARNKSAKRGSNAPIVIGKKVSAGLVSWKGADLTIPRYVGRVAPGTATDDIISSLESCGVDVISLDPLEMKHKRFLSFKLVVKKSQLEIIENPDIWPEGVVVGRWWSPKSPVNNNGVTTDKS